MFAVYPMPAIVTALGLSYVVSLLPASRRLRRLVIWGIALLYLVNISVYLDRYFIHFPRNEAQFWGYGYKKLAEVTDSEPYSHVRTIISHPEYSPYIFLLFYQKTDPELFRQSVIRYAPTGDNFVHVRSFGRFEFRDIDWNRDPDGKTLVVAVSEEVPGVIEGRYREEFITLPDGTPRFTLVSF
jgi:hypothetical protein